MQEANLNYNKDKKQMKSIRIVAPVALVIVIALSSLSIGLPEFSAKAEQKCNLCHVGPSGGGMRNSFGSQFFALNELPAHKTDFENLSKFQTQISNILSLGADMRTMYYSDQNADQSSFFQMEGNLYVSAQLNKQFSLTLNQGLYNGFEVFGMGYVLPFQGYFRVGKFQPTYGWRFDDHTSFVREKMLWPAGSTDTGIEFGIYPHGISANLGFFNGTSGTLDDDNSKALAGRLEYHHNIKGVGFGVGGSYWLNDRTAGDVKMFGPLWYLNLFKGRLLYLGEIDWLEDETITGQPTVEATSHKLGCMLTQGFWLRATYDYYDPDIDLKNGRINRYGVGVQYFPYGFLEIQPNLWYYQDDIGSDDNYTQFNAQMHFFF
jgi:hypothetical protein